MTGIGAARTPSPAEPSSSPPAMLMCIGDAAFACGMPGVARKATAHRHAEFLGPFSVVAIQEVGWALYHGRRFDEAIDQFHKAVELEPGWDQLYFGLGQTLVQQQRHEEAIAALCTAARMGPGDAFTEAALAYAFGRAGRTIEAEHTLARLTEKYAYVPFWFYSIVSIGLQRPPAGAGGVGERLSQSRTVPGEPQSGSSVRFVAPGRAVLGHGAPGRVGAVSAVGSGGHDSPAAGYVCGA